MEFIKLRGIATDAEIKEPDHFANIDEDENELEENKVVLEDLVLCFLLSLNLNNICFVMSHEVLFTCARATQVRASASI